MTFPALAASDSIDTAMVIPAAINHRLMRARSADAATYAIVPERRRDGRFAQSRPIAIYEPAVSRFFGGQTVDVSAKGMKLRLPSWVKLRAGQIIDLHTVAESGGLPLANRRRAILSRVVWTRTDRSGSTPCLLVGIEFLSTTNAEAA